VGEKGCVLVEVNRYKQKISWMGMRPASERNGNAIFADFERGCVIISLLDLITAGHNKEYVSKKDLDTC
jgi:hypothetical protein